MKRNILFISALVLSTAGIAGAQINVNVTSSANANVQAVNASVTGSETVRVQATTSVRGNATSTEKKSENSSTTKTTAQANTSSKNSGVGEEHRSVVANFVQSLLAIADREGGIGAQVRVIAKSQNDTASSSVSAIAKIESRGALKKFLFGTDYKNIGQLRSDMKVTQNNIQVLQNLVSGTVDVNNKMELENQIKTLEASQIKMEAFIKANESSFSLFGWINKN